MKHVGNDIIDLGSPHSKGKSQDKRFVKRILTLKEQKAVSCSARPDDMLWCFWASKETAYKAVSKINPYVTSIPVKYSLIINNSDLGEDVFGIVKTPVCDVAVTIHHHNDFIHCIGITGETFPHGEIIYDVRQIDHLEQPDFNRSSEIESQYVRDMAKKRLTAHLSWNQNDIFITSATGVNRIFYPEVLLKRQKTSIDLSLSHDGRFVAYAFHAND